jgi:hypothetical protein
MTDQQIETLILKGYSLDDIANYGQCSRHQIDHVYLKLIIKQSPNAPKARNAQWILDNRD